MLDTIYMQVLDMSKTAGIVILAVLVVRLLLKKAPKVFSYMLWAVVLFRLLCPFSFEAAVSVVPEIPSVSEGYTLSEEPISVFDAGMAAYRAVGDALNGGLGVQHVGTTEKDETGMTRYVTTDWWSVWILFGQYVWVAGMAAMLVYSAVSYGKVRKKLAVVIPLRDNIFIADDIKSPFVIGLIRPKIYLPCNLGKKEQEYIILHEQHHIKRLDHIVKALAFLALTLHWFNPFVWLAFVLASKDMEMSCDEAVMSKLGGDVRADYSASLLTLATGRRVIAGTPLAFGEGDTRGRIKNLAKWKKPAVWVIALAVITCAVVAVCLLTNPAVSVNERLAVFIDCEIASFHQTEKSKGNFCCLDWEVIGKKTSGNLTTVYMWVLYEEFSNNAGLTIETGSHLLTVITARKEGDSYSLVEYWIPRDGGYYSDSIKEKVPMYLWSKAFDSQRFFGLQSEKLEKMAKAHFKITTPDTASVDRTGHTSVAKWFDYLEKPSEMPLYDNLEISIPEFPNVTFRWSYVKMEAVVGNEITPLYSGMPIWNTYFSDLTGDGIPELCSTYSFGSGMIDNRVIVYDYANGASYELSARGVHDFTLRLSDEDGQLYVDKRSHFGGGLISSGPLVFRDGCIQITGEVTANTAITNIVDPTKDEDFFYDDAVEKFFEDENNEYFFSGIYSQYVIVHYADGTQEDIVVALNNGRATIADLDRFGIRYWAEPKPLNLSSSILSAILEHYKSSDPDGLYNCASFTLLMREELCFDSDPPMPGKVTVYGIALYQAYSFYEGVIREVRSHHSAVALTFEVQNGSYRLMEFWEPQNGTYSEKYIREKFPDEIEDKAMDLSQYLLGQKQVCYEQAVAYSGIDVNAVMEQFLSVIESSPLYSSRPGDYIDAHPDEYRELLYYGDYTLQYIFSKFLEGNQIGLRGHIMRALLDDLAPEAQLRLYAMTGQEYFDEWKAAAIRVSEQHDMEWIKENQYAIWLLLQMIEE